MRVDMNLVYKCNSESKLKARITKIDVHYTDISIRNAKFK